MSWFYSASEIGIELWGRWLSWNNLGFYFPRHCPDSHLYLWLYLDLSSRIFRRKTALVVASVVLLLLTCILAVLELGDFYVGNSIIYSMTVFGLNSFFSMVFFYFLLLAAFEFFPHTIRTISCGIMFCLYRLGKLLFSLHIETIEIPLKRNEGMMELVLCCSILILIHSFMLA